MSETSPGAARSDQDPAHKTETEAMKRSQCPNCNRLGVFVFPLVDPANPDGTHRMV
jgi:hypothetical protein